MMLMHPRRYYSPQSINTANGSVRSACEIGHGTDLQGDQKEKKTHNEDVEGYSIILSNALPTGDKGEAILPHKRAMMIMSRSD